MKIELLSPARDADIGIAAIDCGADAVYIGASGFGAREGAENTIEDIERLCDYAHRYWAKVYVTVNTLLRNEEIPEALTLISRLYNIGIDALIIQDFGLLECDLPPIPLFASTQMHNTTPEKVKFLEQVGFQRVILARELDLDQIRDIRQQTSVELECFVHGALCVSFSGQCYLSYAIGGRSGNRGRCAQPCRRRYSLHDADGKVLSEPRYLLSLKDLNLSEYLEELIDAGVSSFKIEGRLKDKNYVMNIVSFYRQKLDRISEKKNFGKNSSGKSSIDFIPDPYKTFNRGYTRYFLTGRNKEIAAADTPKSSGEKMGKVISAGKDYFITDSKEPFHSGDGICFFDKNRNLDGTTINQVNAGRVYPDKMKGIPKGTLIYRNYNHGFISELKKAEIGRKIGIVLKLSESDTGFLLTAHDEDGNIASADLICEKNSARQPDQAIATIRKQLGRFGGTPFDCTDIVIESKHAWFIPVSELNALRRSVSDKLIEIREQNRPIARKIIVRNSFPYPMQELSYSGNVLNVKAKAFYERHGVVKIMPAIEAVQSSKCKIQGTEFRINMAEKRLMTTKYCLRYQFGYCSKSGKMQNFREPLYLTDEDGRKFRLEFDCENCEMIVRLVSIILHRFQKIAISIPGF